MLYILHCIKLIININGGSMTTLDHLHATTVKWFLNCAREWKLHSKSATNNVMKSYKWKIFCLGIRGNSLLLIISCNFRGTIYASLYFSKLRLHPQIHYLCVKVYILPTTIYYLHTISCCKTDSIYSAVLVRWLSELSQSGSALRGEQIITYQVCNHPISSAGEFFR